MKTLLPSLLFLVGAITTGYSQFTIISDPVEFTKYGEAHETDIEYEIHIVNTSDETASFFWSKRQISGPVEWWTWFCDANLCYLPEVITCPDDAPNVILAGDTAVMSMHINPRHVEGTGVLRITFIDAAGNELEVVEGEYVIGEPNAVADVQKLPQVTITPNPVADVFSLTAIPGAASVSVFDINGKPVQLQPGQLNQWDASALSSGVYALMIFDENQQPIGRSRFVKQ
jgi:archaellum component FlaG (FlaF/FlaG flagellin family)